jgi:hypothetical protein
MARGMGLAVSDAPPPRPSGEAVSSPMVYDRRPSLSQKALGTGEKRTGSGRHWECLRSAGRLTDTTEAPQGVCALL